MPALGQHVEHPSPTAPAAVLSIAESWAEFTVTRGATVLYSRALEEDTDGNHARTVTRLEDDDRKLVHRQYAPGQDGRERLVMELVLTRKPVK